ncbi:MAG: hypothetical protein ACSHW0_18090, partial [Thalassotalea sp.]
MFNLDLGKKIGAAAIIIAGTMSSANALVLDTFDYDVNLTVSGAAGASVSGSANDVSNTPNPGDVDYTLTLISNTGTLFPSKGGSLAADGELYLFNDANASKLEIVYSDDGFDENGIPEALAPIDFTDGGVSTHFYFDIEQVDLGFGLDLLVETVAGNFDIHYDQTQKIESTDPTKRIYLGFLDFNGAGDWSLVTKVTALLTAPTSGDIRISEVGTTSVPEPTTLAIFGL